MSDLTLLSANTERRIRLRLWLGHGHTGQYGDDGEMQCVACLPYGAYDYRRTDLAVLLDVLDAVALSAIAKAGASWPR